MKKIGEGGLSSVTIFVNKRRPPAKTVEGYDCLFPWSEMLESITAYLAMGDEKGDGKISFLYLINPAALKNALHELLSIWNKEYQKECKVIRKNSYADLVGRFKDPGGFENFKKWLIHGPRQRPSVVAEFAGHGVEPRILYLKWKKEWSLPLRCRSSKLDERVARECAEAIRKRLFYRIGSSSLYLPTKPAS